MNINLQDILAYLILAAALFFILKRFFFKKKKKAGSCGKADCGCH
ncbi:FeoB-associated Cys-rich membrane protein [Mangrovibacterium lignilyticum]